MLIEGMVIGVEVGEDRPNPAVPGDNWNDFLWANERFLLVVEHVDGDEFGLDLARGDTLTLYCVASETGYKADGEERLIVHLGSKPYGPCPEAGQSGLFGFDLRRDELVLSYIGDSRAQQDLEYRLREEGALGELGSIPEEFP